MNVQWYFPLGFELYSDAVWNLRAGYGTDEGYDYLMWDTELNVLGSYFMFHAIVRINKMGGKAKRR